MTINWILFLLINGLVLYAACTTACCLVSRNDHPALNVVASGIIYFAQITFCILLLGVVFRYLTPASVQLLSSGLAIGLTIVFRRYRYAVLIPVLRGLRALFAARNPLLYGIAALFLLQVLILAAKVVVLPPHIWDVFSYHLTPAVEWYQQGWIPIEIENPVQRVNSSTLGMTVLSYWFFIFFRDDFLVELPQLLWALLLVPIAYVVLRKESVDSGWAFKFAVLCFFVPIILMQSTTAKDHLGLNIGFIAALLFMYNYLLRGNKGNLIVSSLAFGLVLGYKIVAPIYLAVAGTVFLLLLSTKKNRRLFERKRTIPMVVTIACSSLIMLILGGYWYIRNLALTDQLLGVARRGTRLVDVSKDAGTPLWKAVDSYSSLELVQSKFSYSRVIEGIQQFFPRVFDYQGVYGTDLVQISGFGPQFAAFGLIALLAAIRSLLLKKHRTRPVNLLPYCSILLLIAYAPFYFTSFSYRLYSFFPIALILYGAIRFNDVGCFRKKTSATLTNVVISVCLLWNFANMIPPQYTNLKLFQEFVSLDASHRTSAEYTNWFDRNHPNYYRLMKYIPVDEPIAYVSRAGGGTWTFPYYDRNWRRKIVYLHRPKYLKCGEDLHCVPTEDLEVFLSSRRVSLVTVCETNLCLYIDSPRFKELARGLYYFESSQ